MFWFFLLAYDDRHQPGKPVPNAALVLPQEKDASTGEKDIFLSFRGEVCRN